MSSLNAALLLTALNALAILVGFATSLLVAARFGVGEGMDAYGAASSFHAYILSILSGAVSVFLTPTLAQASAKGESALAGSFNTIFRFVLYFTGVLVLIVVAGAGGIVHFFAPGLGEVGFAKAVYLVRILVPSVLFLVTNDVMAGAYFIRNRVMVPGINKSVAPVLTLLFVAATWGQMDVEAVAWANLAASVVQFALLFFGFRQNIGLPISFRSRSMLPLVGKALRGMLPFWLGLAVYKSVPLIDKAYASLLSTGTIASFSYAEKCVTIVVSLLLGGVSSISFASLAVEHATNRRERFVSKFERIFVALLLLSAPIAWMLCVCPDDLIRLLMQRGNFDAEATRRVASGLSILAWTLPPAVLGTVISQCFYILEKNWLVMTLSVGETMMYAMIAWLSLKWGAIGLLWAKVAYWYASILMFLVALHRFFRFDAGRLFRTGGFALLIIGVLQALTVMLEFAGTGRLAGASVALLLVYLVVRRMEPCRELLELEAAMWARIRKARRAA